MRKINKRGTFSKYDASTVRNQDQSRFSSLVNDLNDSSHDYMAGLASTKTCTNIQNSPHKNVQVQSTNLVSGDSVQNP